MGRRIVADLGGGRALVARRDPLNEYDGGYWGQQLILTYCVNGQHWDSAAFDMDVAQRLHDALITVLRHHRDGLRVGGVDAATGEPYPL